MTRILVVDDHPSIRLAVRQLLAGVPDLIVCGTAESVDEALAAAHALRPDLVITDLSMRQASGLDLIRGLRELDEALPVVVYSMHEEASLVAAAFAAGARGYVTKRKRPEALLGAIREVLGGGYPGRPIP